jgi:hypothetical protein
MQLSFADILGSGNSLDDSDGLTLWDGFNWLETNESTTADTWTTITSLTSTTNFSAILKDLPDLAVDAAYNGGTQKKLTYVQSADGAL